MTEGLMNFGVYTKAHYKTSRLKISSHKAACDMALLLVLHASPSIGF
jgi:hypothetical protein